MHYSSDRALELLKTGSGKTDAFFRYQQEEAIRHIVEGRGKLLVVQKTGWGKSFVYFIATKLMREKGSGPALLVSPLLALMRNQVEAARKMGLRAEAIHNENNSEHADIEHRFVANEVDILLITPERLGNAHFSREILAKVAANISLLIVDEAHCISDWGHDFRPHYRKLEGIIRALPQNMRLLATTATANHRVTEDLRKVLGHDLTIKKGDLNRPSLTLQTIFLPTQEERLAWLADQLLSLAGHGIIYTLTKRDANQVASWLQENGINAQAYTGDSAEQREHLEQALLHNQVKALVSTTALGMGYDKPDLYFVIHYQMPNSVVAYYQQVGRAGRALKCAYGVLLSGSEEDNINNFFIDNAFPTQEEVHSILNELYSAKGGLSVYDLMSKLNIAEGRLKHTIDLLSLESPSPISKQGSKYLLAPVELSQDFWKRSKRLTDLRYQEQSQMKQYVQLRSGHMEFLIDALDGDVDRVTESTLPMLPRQPSFHMLERAQIFLKRTGLPIKPRKKWPAGGLPKYSVSGRIPPNLQANEGMSLCIWGDAGWGRVVREGRYVNKYFADDLVSACAELLKRWGPNPAPVWVTCMPSLRNPNLVPNFAERLADEIGLPFYPALVKIDHTKEQKTMVNAQQQALNIDGTMQVVPELVQQGPVLLIDDIVNSKWTSTVAAWLLRNHGSGEVWPLALSQTGQ